MNKRIILMLVVLCASAFLCAEAWSIPVVKDDNGNQHAAECDADTVTGTITYTPSTVYEEDQVTLNSSYTYSGATVSVTGYKWECYSNCSSISSISSSTSADGAKFTANTAGSVQVRLAISYKCNQVYDSTDYTYKTITINENCTEQTYYQDADGDGYGDSSKTKSECEKPDGYSILDNDCDDTDANINTGEEEVCGNSKDDDCDGQTDESCNTTSCNENSATYLSFHAYFDFCNCPDNDNDGIYEYCGNDGNSHHSMCNTYFFPSGNFDCNDNDASISPTACETCDDGVDNDCDDAIDEDCPVTTTETTPETPATTTTETTTTETPTSETPQTTVSNNPPVADAGDNQTVMAGVTITLDGSGSTDPDGDTLTYSWTETTSTSASLSSSTTVSPTFTAQSAGSYTFQLTVDDGKGETDADQVTIVVAEANASANEEPSVNVPATWGSELLGSGCSLMR